MKKLFLVSFFVISLFGFDWAGKVYWAMNYEVAKKLSQRTNRPIFVDIALSHCPPCKYLATHMYVDDKIASFINKNFIPVLIIADKENVPTEVAQYFSGYTPSLIIMKNGREIYQFSFDKEFLNNKYKFLDYLKKGLK
jgi:thiol-disulfide isomerase/thioredoxin